MNSGWRCYEAKTPLVGKGGVAAPSKNIPVLLKGADGVVRSTSEWILTVALNEPPRLRPAKVASRHFIDGRSHPSFAKTSPRRGIPAHSVFLVCRKLSREIRMSELWWPSGPAGNSIRIYGTTVSA